MQSAQSGNATRPESPWGGEGRIAPQGRTVGAPLFELGDSKEESPPPEAILGDGDLLREAHSQLARAEEDHGHEQQQMQQVEGDVHDKLHLGHREEVAPALRA